MADNKGKLDGLKNVLRKTMPFISVAAGLGGPFGVAAARAVQGMLDAGKPVDQATKIDPTLDGILGAIASSTDPEAILKAQAAENQFAIEMQQAGFKDVETLAQLAAADRDSARQMAIKTGDVWTPRILAAVVVVGWIVVQFYVIPHAIQVQAKDPMTLGRILGTLDGALMLVLAYYFGSSAGSAEKSHLLAQQPENKS